VGGGAAVVEVESQSGTIELRVPAKHAVAEFDLLTIGGTITNHLSEAAADAPSGRHGAGAAVLDRGGGAQVTARSFKGRILLEPK